MYKLWLDIEEMSVEIIMILSVTLKLKKLNVNELSYNYWLTLQLCIADVKKYVPTLHESNGKIARTKS